MGAGVLLEADGRRLRRLALAEDGVEAREAAADGLGHAVVEVVAGGDLVAVERAVEGGCDDHAALDALDRVFKRACARNHRGERALWRYRTSAGADVEEDCVVVFGLAAAVDGIFEYRRQPVVLVGKFAVVQNCLQCLQFLLIELFQRVDKVQPSRAHFLRADCLCQSLQAELEGGRARDGKIRARGGRHRVGRVMGGLRFVARVSEDKSDRERVVTW
jgi:hypothetical protein